MLMCCYVHVPDPLYSSSIAGNVFKAARSRCSRSPRKTQPNQLQAFQGKERRGSRLSFHGASCPDDDGGDEPSRGEARELGEDPVFPAGDVDALAALEGAEAAAGDFFGRGEAFAFDARREREKPSSSSWSRQYSQTYLARAATAERVASSMRRFGDHTFCLGFD